MAYKTFDIIALYKQGYSEGYQKARLELQHEYQTKNAVLKERAKHFITQTEADELKRQIREAQNNQDRSRNLLDGYIDLISQIKTIYSYMNDAETAKEHILELIGQVK